MRKGRVEIGVWSIDIAGECDRTFDLDGVGRVVVHVSGGNVYYSWVS